MGAKQSKTVDPAPAAAPPPPRSKTELLLGRVFDVIENDILPLAQAGYKSGRRPFGAAIIKKSDLSLVTAGVSSDPENPIQPAEVDTINKFFQIPVDHRPDAKDCYFISTHEPNCLGLSAITWAGFDNFYFFFSYADTRDVFNVQIDLKAITEVFKLENGEYARQNSFWTGYDLMAIVGEECGQECKDEFTERAVKLKGVFDGMRKGTHKRGRSSGSWKVPGMG